MGESFRAALIERGWIIVDGVKSREDLIKVAASVGPLIRASNGQLVKSLIPRSNVASLPRTFSDRYGTGAFPFHTDTAFWAVPARYLAFRVSGDLRRRTGLCSFAYLLQRFSPAIRAAIHKSIWLVSTPHRCFYSSMEVRDARGAGWRYDPNCMYAMNSAARDVAEAMEHEFAVDDNWVDWIPDQALLVSNWTVLHSRGNSPVEEGVRLLDRIYVG